MLRSLGREVLSVDNAPDAIKLVKTGSVGLVISDLMMPKMDGLQMINELRKELFTASVPVVMVSAATSAETIDQAMKLNVVSFLKKPVSADRLRQIARDALDAQPYRSQSPASGAAAKAQAQN